MYPALTSFVAEHRDLVARVATEPVKLHHFVIAPSTHHKTARNSHVVASRTAQEKLSRFQQRLTRTSPVCQRHHVFLSTRVHDLFEQVPRFTRREIRVVANRQSVRRDSRIVANRQCPHVLNFSLLFRLSGLHLDSPSTCVPTRRSTHLALMSTFATETATFVSTMAIRSSMTDLSTTVALVCVPTARAAFARTLATAARGT